MLYKKGELIIESDYEIRVLREENDVDIMIDTQDRTTNLNFFFPIKMPISRIQLPQVNRILIRFCKDNHNNWATLHFLRNMDLQSHIINFEIDYSKYRILVKDQEFYIDFFIEEKE